MADVVDPAGPRATPVDDGFEREPQSQLTLSWRRFRRHRLALVSGIVLLTMVLAPVLLLAADIVGRVVLPPGELQVGIVTAFVGAPVLIALARRRRVSGL